MPAGKSAPPAAGCPGVLSVETGRTFFLCLEGLRIGKPELAAPGPEKKHTGWGRRDGARMSPDARVSVVACGLQGDDGCFRVTDVCPHAREVRVWAAGLGFRAGWRSACNEEGARRNRTHDDTTMKPTLVLPLI